ncbi:MAG: sodium:proton antiporter [Lachnospiraceae bacterium]|nr:sodium:proton antiporter [Lachnospiraceae bacterium]
MGVLQFLIIILILIVVIGISNEKIFHIQSDIAIILFSLIGALIILAISHFFRIEPVDRLVAGIGEFGFEEYLMDGVLCFMLFSGASKVNMRKFRQNVRAISLLALLTTVISSVVYGLLFYLVSMAFHLQMDLLTCILVGCIVSPTDPIAATGILNKIGLSKNVCSVIENESLFNDGTGVTLFIFVRSLVSNSGRSNFFVLMLKEILGAVAVAFIVSFLLFQLMKITRDPIKYILISLLDVSLVYMICEHMGFSGVIASVVCGMYFSASFGKMERRAMVIDPKELYKDFWEIVESLLNSVLFVMIGLMVLNVNISKYVLVIVPAAVLINLLARATGVGISSVLTGKSIPGNYTIREYVALMTWSALKGGLSLALAISTEEFLPRDIYDIVINVTYVTIFFTVLAQGLTVKNVYLAIEKHKSDRFKNGRKIPAE